MATLIKDVLESELGTIEPVAEKLRSIAALGYRSAEQFAGVAKVARPAMESYLRADVSELLDILRPDPLPETEFNVVYSTDYGLGADIASLPAASFFAPDVFLAEDGIPGSVDFTLDMPEIRNQNPRGTCIAHAAVAVFEHFRRKQEAVVDLSEQFLTFICKKNDKLPHQEGTRLSIAFSRLVIDGCCREETWPYNNQSNPCNWGQGPPPQGAIGEAETFRIPGLKRLPQNDVNALKTVLASGRAIAFTIPAYKSWFCNDEVKISGNIVIPPPGDEFVGGHAMCMVGYRDMADASDLGGGVFLIRNSWGDRWGLTSAVKGYGTVPYRFITNSCVEAFTIDA
jgi:hypothetical protein